MINDKWNKTSISSKVHEEAWSPILARSVNCMQMFEIQVSIGTLYVQSAEACNSIVSTYNQRVTWIEMGAREWRDQSYS